MIIGGGGESPSPVPTPENAIACGQGGFKFSQNRMYSARILSQSGMPQRRVSAPRASETECGFTVTGGGENPIPNLPYNTIAYRQSGLSILYLISLTALTLSQSGMPQRRGVSPKSA